MASSVPDGSDAFDAIAAPVGQFTVSLAHVARTTGDLKLLVSSWRLLKWPTTRTFASSPNGIRTRAAALKGRCPRPLDDGALPGSSLTEAG
jgi:hypothetical protein